MDETKFSSLEQEAIILNAVRSMVDDMVNHAIFCPLGDKTHDTNLLPQTADTLRQFTILLRDFLSPISAKRNEGLPFDLPKPPDNPTHTDNTTLFYLRQICDDPQIGGNIEELAALVDDFIAWLEFEAFLPKVHFAGIGEEIDLRIKRIEFVRMGGDIGKHNFLRLRGQANKLQKILSANGLQISQSQAYTLLPDCWDWFHTHLFAYHASTLAEFLNNIRYAILAYARPVARKAYYVTHKIDEYADHYSFDRPNLLKDEFAWGNYFELLQASLRAPNFPRFSVTMSLKSQF